MQSNRKINNNRLDIVPKKTCLLTDISMPSVLLLNGISTFVRYFMPNLFFQKTRHDWVGKAIYSELCKKLKFDHRFKLYMHNSESVLKTETQKVFWDFEIQMDDLISAKRQHQVIVGKKRIFRIADFAVSEDHRIKIKKAKREITT